MVGTENSFLEYLQLQEGDPSLVTKSELIAAVRQAGYRLTARKLAFYTAEGLVPHSVRVGSHSGVYPRVVVDLMKWILRARDAHVSTSALRELMPVWRFLIRVRAAGVLDIAELELVARQHVASVEGSINVPRLVIDTLGQSMDREIEILYKADALGGRLRKRSSAPDATLGFAIVKPADEVGDSQWFAATRIAIAPLRTYASESASTVILGAKPNEKLPPDPGEMIAAHVEYAKAESADARHTQ
ncbi:hypothetical protein ACFV24_34430 [Nocardia fluminea]|uniref:hypothetical protein n=1 Tax=Nocardia fluminea TaxID=134984 RepID=UPI00366DF668